MYYIFNSHNKDHITDICIKCRLYIYEEVKVIMQITKSRTLKAY